MNINSDRLWRGRAGAQAERERKIWSDPVTGKIVSIRAGLARNCQSSFKLGETRKLGVSIRSKSETLHCGVRTFWRHVGLPQCSGDVAIFGAKPAALERLCSRQETAAPPPVSDDGTAAQSTAQLCVFLLARAGAHRNDWASFVRVISPPYVR